MVAFSQSCGRATIASLPTEYVSFSRISACNASAVTARFCGVGASNTIGFCGMTQSDQHDDVFPSSQNTIASNLGSGKPRKRRFAHTFRAAKTLSGEPFSGRESDDATPFCRGDGTLAAGLLG